MKSQRRWVKQANSGWKVHEHTIEYELLNGKIDFTGHKIGLLHLLIFHAFE